MTTYLTAAERDVAERFTNDVANHQMTVLHDDGLYRHLRFAQPERSGYWFEIVTWPGSLAIRGDMGGHLFSRVTDMLEFFRGRNINSDYWAEKTPDCGTSLKQYSADAFVQHVTERLDEFAEEDPALAQSAKAEILAAVRSGDASHIEGARELLSFWEGKGVFSDTWEWDLTEWSYQYLWCCHAIVWAIQRYDAIRASAATR